jgi:hypothetical protein
MIRVVMVIATTSAVASCGLVPTLGAKQCMRGAQIRPGMTEPQVVALMGKPYGITVSRDQLQYTWMNNEGGRDVRVQFGLADDGKVEHSTVTHVSGSCDGKSF